MKASITTEEVRRIAALAKLDLDAETVERFREQLASILDYVAMLDEVTAAPPQEREPASSDGRRREDLPRPSLPVDGALGNAPQAIEGHFGVPRVIDSDRDQETES